VSWQAHPYGAWASNGFGLAFAGHRLEAYLRLPEGWTTTPTGLPTDQFMWTKFARQPWCRIRSLQWPVSLHFPAPDRRDWTEQQRVDEFARWTEIIARPNGMEHLYRAMLRTFGDLLLDHGLMVTQQQAAAAAALEREQALRATAEGERNAEQTLRTKAEAERDAQQTLRAKAEAERDAEQRVRTYAQAERDVEQMLRAQAQAERDAMRESTFWRLTGPLRATINLFKGL
jgi:hypothetical protein